MDQLKLFFTKEYLEGKDFDQKTRVSIKYYSQENCKYDSDIKRVFKEYMTNISKEVLFIQKNLTISQIDYMYELIEKESDI